jgi:transposase
MKTQLSKPAGSKARYTEEYKKEALELWRASGRSAAKIAAELGIRAPLLYRWARPKLQANLSGNESKSGRSVEELEAEIRRLRAENAKLLEQRVTTLKTLSSTPIAEPSSPALLTGNCSANTA